jgi:hypothetical protein
MCFPWRLGIPDTNRTKSNIKDMMACDKKGLKGSLNPLSLSSHLTKTLLT